jgi:hypothetical protein
MRLLLQVENEARVSDAFEIKPPPWFPVHVPTTVPERRRRTEGKTDCPRIPFPFAFGRTKTENVVKLQNISLSQLLRR